MGFRDVQQFVDELDRVDDAQADAEVSRHSAWADLAVTLAKLVAGVRV